MNSTDGTQPSSGVIFGSSGSLFGTANGGSKASGVVFRLNESATGEWQETIIYAAGNGLGYYFSPAVSGLDSIGNLYGTTNVGPPELLDGGVFRLEPPAGEGQAWGLNLLYSFTGGSNGGYPNPKLTRQADNLFGTTQQGGDGSACQFGCGAVFKLAP